MLSNTRFAAREVQPGSVASKGGITEYGTICWAISTKLWKSVFFIVLMSRMGFCGDSSFRRYRSMFTCWMISPVRKGGASLRDLQCIWPPGYPPVDQQGGRK